MSGLENLPPDQRAVLQMVLGRGRSYDEIASLLAIDRAAVRQRALDAFDALAPATVLPGPESALITDYLLGQLPDKVAEQVYGYLEASDSDRAWAQAVAASLEPLASGSLPEIPAGAPLGAGDRSGGGPERPSDPLAGEPSEPAGPAEEPASADDLPPARVEQPPDVAPVAAVAPEAAGDDPWSAAGSRRPTPREPRPTAREPRPSSRLGGAILLGTIGAAIVAVVLIVVLVSGGGKKAGTGAGRVTSTRTAQGTTTVTTATTATTTTATTTMLAQLNLTSPTGAKSTLGVVQVVRVSGVIGIILRAQGMPPNTAHNAYAVWLYNSPSSYRFVGFVQYLVGKNGQIDTEGQLKPGAAAYHHLLITLETQQKPKAPGEVVLSGPFREHP